MVAAKESKKYHSATGLSRLNFGVHPDCMFLKMTFNLLGQVNFGLFWEAMLGIRECVHIYIFGGEKYMWHFGFHGRNWHPWVVNASVGMVFVETWGIPWTKAQSLSSSESELNNVAWEYGVSKGKPPTTKKARLFLPGENIRGISPFDSHGKLWHRGRLCVKG